MLNKEDMSKKARYGIIAAGWILYLLIGLGGGGSKWRRVVALCARASISSGLDFRLHGLFAYSKAAGSRAFDDR